MMTKFFLPAFLAAISAATVASAAALPQNADSCKARGYVSLLLCDWKDFGKTGARHDWLGENGDCRFFSTDDGNADCVGHLGGEDIRDTERVDSGLKLGACYVLGAMSDRTTSFDVVNGCCEFYEDQKCENFFFSAHLRRDRKLLGDHNDSISSFICRHECTR